MGDSRRTKYPERMELRNIYVNKNYKIKTK
jgi:hypothetical protein